MGSLPTDPKWNASAWLLLVDEYELLNMDIAGMIDTQESMTGQTAV